MQRTFRVIWTLMSYIFGNYIINYKISYSNSNGDISSFGNKMVYQKFSLLVHGNGDKESITYWSLIVIKSAVSKKN